MLHSSGSSDVLEIRKLKSLSLLWGKESYVYFQVATTLQGVIICKLVAQQRIKEKVLKEITYIIYFVFNLWKSIHCSITKAKEELGSFNLFTILFRTSLQEICLFPDLCFFSSKEIMNLVNRARLTKGWTWICFFLTLRMSFGIQIMWHRLGFLRMKF